MATAADARPGWLGRKCASARCDAAWAPRSCRARSETPRDPLGAGAGADAGFSALPTGNSRPGWPGLEPSERLRPGSLSSARPAQAAGGGAERIPARRPPPRLGAGPGAVFGGSQDTCEHPGPPLGRRGLGKREALL